jgi:CubicO group peptidase (beta-lactamase class C family)
MTRSKASSLNAFEKRLARNFEAHLPAPLETITPGLQLRVYSRGRLKGGLEFGKTYRFYDLASLTKILFTVPNLMRLVEVGCLDLNQTVRHYLPWFAGPRTRVGEILSHSAGLPWWAPFYRRLKGPLAPEKRWRQLETKLHRVRPRRQSTAVYSDVDFLVLGYLLEAVTEVSLFDLFTSYHQSLELNRFTLHFNPGNRPNYRRESYAPTERCPWRKKILQGEVHDENAWALGGVAPHAGLFGTLDDVSRWALLLRQAYVNPRGSALIGQKTLRHFSRRAIPRARGDWALGFMLPTRGKASCGKYFSAQSFGHTGFTGTSIWFDPKADLLAVILSNRVHPTRKNAAFVSLRPQIHDWIVQSLD